MEKKKTKKCSKCGETKVLSEFKKRKDSKSGIAAKCKLCFMSPNARECFLLKQKGKKRCTACKIVKIFEEFYKDRSNPHSQCKECVKAQFRKYYAPNKEKIIKRNKERRKNTPYKKLSEEKKKVVNLRRKLRYKNEPNFKMGIVLRGQINRVLKNNIKTLRAEQLLGAPKKAVMNYLESQFTEGMTWKNHGEWHIDHIIPCASFDLSKEAEQKKCFNYTNLQPLWANDNLRKLAKLDWQPKS